VEHLQQSQSGYEFLTKYATKFPESLPVFEQEFDICAQMASLLPTKLAGIRLANK
jgi:hypothetical protein